MAPCFFVGCFLWGFSGVVRETLTTPGLFGHLCWPLSCLFLSNGIPQMLLLLSAMLQPVDHYAWADRFRIVTNTLTE
mgnify:CR=1 FL=1